MGRGPAAGASWDPRAIRAVGLRAPVCPRCPASAGQGGGAGLPLAWAGQGPRVLTALAGKEPGSSLTVFSLGHSSVPTSVSVNSERLATREAPEPTSSLCAHPRARRPVRLLRGSGLRIPLLVKPGRRAGGQPPRGRRRPGSARGWVERPPSGSARIGTYCPQRCARQARRRPPVGMSPTDRHACADADGPDSHVALSGGATIHTATCHRESHADKCRAAQGGLAAEGRGLRGWAGRSPACGYRAAGSSAPQSAVHLDEEKGDTDPGW